jgi:uncharacterized protein with HEPN domain
MTQHNDDITLRQMLDLASEAIAFAKGRQRQDFDTDRMWSLAMERLLITVGEASRRLSDTTRERLSQIPWAQISAFRNRIIHGYDAIDYDRVWEILESDVPALVAELEKLNLPEFG